MLTFSDTEAVGADNDGVEEAEEEEASKGQGLGIGVLHDHGILDLVAHHLELTKKNITNKTKRITTNRHKLFHPLAHPSSSPSSTLFHTLPQTYIGTCGIDFCRAAKMRRERSCNTSLEIARSD